MFIRSLLHIYAQIYPLPIPNVYCIMYFEKGDEL